MKTKLLLVPGLAGFLMGCTFTGTDSLNKVAPAPASIPENKPITKKEENLPIKAPKAATCIAFADFRAQEAASKDRPALQRQQLQEDARKAYQQALEIERDNLQALVGLARLYVQMEDFQHAQSTYELAAKMHPKKGGVWFELGMLHARKKDWKQSLEYLTRAVELEPENRQFLNNYGFTLARSGNFEESLKVFLRTNEPSKARYQVARMMNHVGRNDEARELLTKALAEKPDYPEAIELLSTLGK